MIRKVTTNLGLNKLDGTSTAALDECSSRVRCTLRDLRRVQEQLGDFLHHTRGASAAGRGFAGALGGFFRHAAADDTRPAPLRGSGSAQHRQPISEGDEEDETVEPAASAKHKRRLWASPDLRSLEDLFKVNHEIISLSLCSSVSLLFILFDCFYLSHLHTQHPARLDVLFLTF